MAQVSVRTGGAPVAADVLVACDQVTILGSGTAQDPLRAASVTPPSQIERITSSGGVVTIDPDVELSIVTDENTSAVVASMAAPTSNLDGYQKTILFTYTPVIDAHLWRLLVTVQTGLGIGFELASGGGAVVLIWNATLACWMPTSLVYSTPIFV